MSERRIYTLVGFVMLIAIECLRWLAGAPPEFCTAMTGLAAVAMAGGPSLIRGSDERGHTPLSTLVGFVVLGLILTLGWASAGCATTRNGEELAFTLRKDPGRPAPACLYRVTLDGELVVEGSASECPAAPVCEEPR